MDTPKKTDIQSCKDKTKNNNKWGLSIPSISFLLYHLLSSNHAYAQESIHKELHELAQEPDTTAASAVDTLTTHSQDLAEIITESPNDALAILAVISHEYDELVVLENTMIENPISHADVNTVGYTATTVSFNQTSKSTNAIPVAASAESSSVHSGGEYILFTGLVIGEIVAGVTLSSSNSSHKNVQNNGSTQNTDTAVIKLLATDTPTEDTYEIQFILNRITDVNDTGYKSIDTLMTLDYQSQQDYINELTAEQLTTWYGFDNSKNNEVTSFLSKSSAEKIVINNEERTLTFTIGEKELHANFKLAENKKEIMANSDSFNNHILGMNYLIHESDEITLANNTVTKAGIAPQSTHANRAELFPVEIAKMYNFPKVDNTSGSNQKIGIIAIGQDYDKLKAGLEFYVRLQHDKSSIKLNVNEVGTDLYKEDPDDYKPNLGEFDLDISIIASILPGAEIYLLGINDHKGSLYSSYAEGIYDGDDYGRVDVISSSYGQGQDSNYQTTIFNSLMQDAMLRDITVVIAAGDRGSANAYSLSDMSVPEMKPVALSFSGSPYATSVGGTSLSQKGYEHMSLTSHGETHRDYTSMHSDADLAPTDTAMDIGNQVLWNELNSGTQSDWKVHYGGEVTFIHDDRVTIPQKEIYSSILTNNMTSSGIFDTDINPRPNYQQNAAKDIDGGRSYPDVSFLAGSNTDANVGFRYIIADHDEGHIKFSGGTSAAAPLMASLVGLINAEKSENLGFINPLLYEIYDDSSKRGDVFFDVLSGSNNDNLLKIDTTTGDYMITGKKNDSYTVVPVKVVSEGDKKYSTAEGFDPASGLGSINGQELLDYLNALDQDLAV